MRATVKLSGKAPTHSRCVRVDCDGTALETRWPVNDDITTVGHSFRDVGTFEPHEDFQRVAKGETAIEVVPRDTDVSAVKGSDSRNLDRYNHDDDFHRVGKSETALKSMPIDTDASALRRRFSRELDSRPHQDDFQRVARSDGTVLETRWPVTDDVTQVGHSFRDVGTFEHHEDFQRVAKGETAVETMPIDADPTHAVPFEFRQTERMDGYDTLPHCIR